MPLVGFQCPDNQFAVKQIADCEKCENRCLPIEIVRWIWDTEMVRDKDHYHNDPKVLSVTETMRGSCLRKAYFNRTVDYTETPQSLMARSSGTGVHKRLEQANDDGYSEVALSYDLGGGYTLKGTADRLTADYIGDYKTVDAVRKTYDLSNAEQLSIYRDMAGGVDRELVIWQVARKKVATHVVHYVEDAFGECLDRCGLLIDTLASGQPEMLPTEGKNIKFFKMTACDFCSHVDECAAVGD